MTALPDKMVDPRLRDFVRVEEVEFDSGVADSLFLRKYAHPAPTYPHHLAVFYSDAAGREELAHFLHFFSSGNLWLIGGACTDGDVVRRMHPDQRAAVDAAGGLMLQATRFGLHRFGASKDAIFGHCGDARSFEVLMRAGFQPLRHPHLLVYWPRLVDESRRCALCAEAEALGPF
ncbi:MAG: hypothetical protein WBV39_09335 [Rudaea sp.]